MSSSPGSLIVLEGIDGTGRSTQARMLALTMAYQGARGFDPLEIRRRNEDFAPKPDLVAVSPSLEARGIPPIPTPTASAKARRGEHSKSNWTTSEFWFLNPPDRPKAHQPKNRCQEHPWHGAPESYARGQ